MAKQGPVVISNETPFIAGDLTVYPDRFQYRDAKCNLCDVIHVGWYWLSQTINFVNTQEVKFYLHIRGADRPIKITKTTMYVTPKLVTAYNYIAQQTFKSRLLQYTEQLEEHGAFTFQDCTFYSDGQILGNGNTFSLQKAEFEPFQMTVKQGGLFSPRLNVSLITDKDVIVSLLNYILKNPVNPSEVKASSLERKRSQQALDGFLINVISMLAKLASADGKITADEIGVIKDFTVKSLKLSADKMKMVVEIFRYAKTAPEPFEVFARNIFTNHRGDIELLRNILDLLFSVATADNLLSAEEELLLVQAEEIFGIHGPAFSAFRAQRESRKAPRHRDPKSLECEYFELFGLSIEAAPTEIKAKYRRLVMQYHPDRVHHLGNVYREEAEKKMKQINIAYEHFSKKYGF